MSLPLLPPEEIDFLRDLRDATNFAGWSSVYRRGWVELGRKKVVLSGEVGKPRPFRGCAGVKAEYVDRRGIHHVSSIDLHEANLHGELPSSLRYLLQLRYLDLRDNRLHGHLPERWPEELETVLLYRNNFTGMVPAGWGRLEKCRILQAWENKLEGELPPELCACSSLRVLYLGKNLLEGELPRHFGRLRSLRRLWLENNRFSGKLPRSFAKLKRLQWLRLENNRFEPELSTGELQAMLGRPLDDDDPDAGGSSSSGSSSEEDDGADSGMCGNTTGAEALDAAQEATKALSFGDQGSSASSRQSKDRRKRERKQAETFALAAARARRVSQTTLVTKGTIKAAQNWKRRTGVGKLPSVEVPPAPAIDISQAALFSESAANVTTPNVRKISV
eukprot:g337.t1